MSRLAGLHYEMALIEEGRARVAEKMGECVDRRAQILEKIQKKRHECPQSQDFGPESGSLFRELREIGDNMRDISLEGEWLEMEMAKKKYLVLTVQQQHFVVDL